MSKLQHTKGPWKTKGDGVIYVDVKNSNHKYNSALKLGSGWHEDTWCDEDADEETLANARLVAAAPEMLEALITTYKAFNTDGHEYDCGRPCEGCECFSSCPNITVKQAIEKATGLAIEEVLAE